MESKYNNRSVLAIFTTVRTVGKISKCSQIGAHTYSVCVTDAKIYSMDACTDKYSVQDVLDHIWVETRYPCTVGREITVCGRTHCYTKANGAVQWSIVPFKTFYGHDMPVENNNNKKKTNKSKRRSKRR